MEPVRSAIRRAAIFEQALRDIMNRRNQVCPEYTICDHPVCNSSYEAFAIADGALHGREWPREEGVISNGQ